MTLIELYTSMLAAAGLTVDDNGYVSVNNSLFTGSNKNEPVLVDGKRLVLPTREQLTDPDRESKIIFHPLSENILRGESIVVAKLRSMYGIRLNFAVAAIVSGLLDLCASVNKHKLLTPDQSAVLSVAPNCDETTVRVFASLINKVFADESTFVKLYLRRSGTIKGVKYSRAGIISFPFFEALQEAKDTLFGVKLRKKDKEALLAIFEFILPKIGEAESYNQGSDSTIAPFTDALMKAFMGVAGKLNDIIDLYKDKIDELEKLTFDADWVDAFEDLSVMTSEIRRVPAQAGNEGEGKKTDSIQQATTPVTNLQYTPPTNTAQSTALAPNPVAVPQYQPQYTQMPVTNIPQTTTAPVQTKTSEGKVKLGDLMSKTVAMPAGPIPPSLMGEMNPQLAQQMAYQQQMQQMAMMQQGMVPGMQPGYQMSMGYPQQMPMGYPQQMMNQPGMPRSAGSVMPNNPVGMPNQMGYPMQPGMMPMGYRPF